MSAAAKSAPLMSMLAVMALIRDEGWDRFTMHDSFDPECVDGRRYVYACIDAGSTRPTMLLDGFNNWNAAADTARGDLAEGIWVPICIVDRAYGYLYEAKPRVEWVASK